MALVDFGLLVNLYNLHCGEERLLPPHPSPSTMPSVAPSQPPTRPMEFAPPTRNLSPIVEREWPPSATPANRGSSVRMKQEGDTDKTPRYKREDYDDYIREDLTNRVFVDLEVFMKVVLRVPDDWRETWEEPMTAVKSDKNFNKYHREYCQQCETVGSLESSFYVPLVNTTNAILAVLRRPEFSTTAGRPQHYVVNDPQKLRGGVMNKANLSPDLVLLDDECKPSGTSSLHWANALHVLEVKPHDGAICDGENMPRLVVDGEFMTSAARARP